MSSTTSGSASDTWVLEAARDSGGELGRIQDTAAPVPADGRCAPIQQRAGDEAMVMTKIAYGLSGLLGAGIIFIGVRFLVQPQAAAAGYGIADEHNGPTSDPYLAVKGVRDIAFGVVTFVLLAAERPHILGRYLVAASIVPIGDATIVLRRNGPKATAYGVHGATAAGMLGTAAVLLRGPE